MNLKIILFLILTNFLIADDVIDTDFDGVEDSKDTCPNTSFTDIVDLNGCKIKTVIKNKENKHKLSISLGYSYLDNGTKTINDSTSIESFQLNYYYNNFNIVASTAYYQYDSDSSNTSGQLDTYIGIGYKIKSIDNLSISISSGAYLPTYKEDKNNKVDFKFGGYISYYIDNFNIFSSYNYTIVNDKDTTEIEYVNNYSHSFGIGYYFNKKLYTNLSYLNSSSIYNVNDINIESISLTTYYNFTDKIYGKLEYGKGLNDSSVDNKYSFSLGYSF